MAWQKNGTPDTLTGAGDILDIADLTSLKFNQFLLHDLASGLITSTGRIDGTSSSSYAVRRNLNSVEQSLLTSQTEIETGETTSADDEFQVWEVINISGEEKLIIYHSVNRELAGSGTPPSRWELVAKYVITSGQFTQITITNGGSGSYDTDSNLSALGTD